MGRRKTGTIIKRGDQWYIKYTINGERIQKVTNARTKSEAQEILSKALSKEINYVQRGDIIVKDFAEKWFERRKVALKPSVVDSYRTTLNKHIVPYFGDRKLGDIYAGDIEDFRAHLLRKKRIGGKTLSPKTVNNVLIILHRIFDDAVDDRRIEINPVIFRKHKATYNPTEKDHFTLEEMNLFLKNVNPVYKPFFITAWHTSLRLGELIGLKWDDIDLRRKAVIVQRSLYQKHQTNMATVPKTKSGKRVIFMTPLLYEILKEYKADKETQSIEGYIFEKDNKPFNKNGIVRSQFKQALRKSGLRKTLTPHSIRHGLISLMRRYFPDYIVKRMVGHSLGNNVTEVYTHVTDEEMQQYAIRLGELLGHTGNETTKKIFDVK